MGAFVVLAGAPGACKTTLATELGHDWATEGVSRRARADEGGLGLVVRVGQLAGEGRDDLENGDPFALERLAQLSETKLASLMIVDGPSTGA